MGKVLSFGELLLRVSPDANGKWLTENRLPVYIGGAEANVASALSRWKIPSKYMTAVPDCYMSFQLIDALKQQNIDTSAIQIIGKRIGVYYLGQGADLQTYSVMYDRKNSSFSELKPGILDWDMLLADVSWLHFSAICPAINESLAAVCEEMLQHACNKSIQISLDLNYRSKLWQRGRRPIDVMTKLAPYVDLMMGNIWAADKMLGIRVDEELIKNLDKESLSMHSLKTSEKITNRFPKCKTVANTFRFDENEGISYFSTLYSDRQFISSTEYKANKVVDKVGSGDCYMAGLIYGFYLNHPLQETMEFATAAAFDQLFVPSDATDSTVDHIQKRRDTYGS